MLPLFSPSHAFPHEVEKTGWEVTPRDERERRDMWCPLYRVPCQFRALEVPGSLSQEGTSVTSFFVVPALYLGILPT
jgi:hypothetical protein